MNKETVGTIIELAVKAASDAIIMLSDHKRERKRQQIEDEIREKREQLNNRSAKTTPKMYFFNTDLVC